MDDSHVIARLREQLTNLCGLFALSLLLHGRVEDDEILELVVSAVPALGPCRVEGAYLIRDETRRNGNRPSPGSDRGLRTQLDALAGAAGQLTLTTTGWAWAYPLRGLGRHCGYLVVSAPAAPSPNEQFLIGTLAQQAGAALNSAASYRNERSTSQKLRQQIRQLTKRGRRAGHGTSPPTRQ
jgi:hypothetical protein